MAVGAAQGYARNPRGFFFCEKKVMNQKFVSLFGMTYHLYTDRKKNNATNMSRKTTAGHFQRNDVQ